MLPKAIIRHRIHLHEGKLPAGPEQNEGLPKLPTCAPANDEALLPWRSLICVRPQHHTLPFHRACWCPACETSKELFHKPSGTCRGRPEQHSRRSQAARSSRRACAASWTGPRAWSEPCARSSRICWPRHQLLKRSSRRRCAMPVHALLGCMVSDNIQRFSAFQTCFGHSKETTCSFWPPESCHGSVVLCQP